MREKKSIDTMCGRELRVYRRNLSRQREIRRKFITVIMTVCLVLVCAVSYHSISTSAHGSKDGEQKINFKYYTSITVAYGETLWDIADSYIDYGEYESKQDYLAEVQSINHLDEEYSIRAGQTLIVPYFSTEFVR